MKKETILFLHALMFSTCLLAQGKVLYFDWYAIPAYTNFSSTKMLTPCKGEIGFGTSNFCLWGGQGSASNDTIAGYDTRTLDLVFRLGLLPHFDMGVKYSSPLAVVLDARGGFERGKFEFNGSMGVGYLHSTKFTQPGNYTFYLVDGYPALALGCNLTPWFRVVLSAKGIVSYYIRQIQTSSTDPQNFFTLHGGCGLTLDIGTEEWRIRPEIIKYKGITYSNLTSEPGIFDVATFGISVVYRPKGN
ncbi:hypothetical protein GX441_05430 [bacterium]|nr:hypothetical protein [bacterium]